MQIKAFTLVAALATFATGTTASPTARPSYKTFHVTNFVNPCTKSIPPQCSYTFDLSLDSLPSAKCSFRDTATDYVICGFGIPEQTYSAYVQKPKDKNGRANLQAKYRVINADGSADNYFGNITLPQPGRNFNFPVVAGSHQVP